MIINRKRHEGIRAYKVKGKDEYVLIDNNDSYFNKEWMYGGCGLMIEGNINSACYGTFSSGYLSSECYDIRWKKIPKEWQVKFLEWLNIGDDK